MVKKHFCTVSVNLYKTGARASVWEESYHWSILKLDGYILSKALFRVLQNVWGIFWTSCGQGLVGWRLYSFFFLLLICLLCMWSTIVICGFSTALPPKEERQAPLHSHLWIGRSTRVNWLRSKQPLTTGRGREHINIMPSGGKSELSSMSCHVLLQLV